MTGKHLLRHLHQLGRSKLSIFGKSSMYIVISRIATKERVEK